MFNSLYRHLVIPAYESGWHRRRTFRYLRELETSQWLPADELRRQQSTTLRRLLIHSSETCPYYRDEWERLTLNPRSINSLADFTRWPVISRETIQANRMKMRSVQPGLKLIKKATGGSSGVPLQFDLNHDSNDRRMAASHRGYGWAGADVGTKQFYLWGGTVGKQSRWKQWKDRLYHLLYRRQVANSFGLSDENAIEYLARLNRYRPDAIVAYTNPLYHFARVLEERGLKPWQPIAIVVGAEKLHGFQRQLIERVFQSPVFETYGSREFMLIGGECSEHAGLHLTMENLLVEILDDEGNATPVGEEGNVVVTDLTNFGMPFIRYANGDRAVAGSDTCHCGRGLPLLKQVVGRRLDTLHTPDGRLVPGEFFPHFLKDFSVVRRFQVVQHALDDVELKVVCRGSWGAGERDAMICEIESLLGEAVGFRVTEVDEIPLTSAGKLRVVVSHCREDQTASIR